MPVVTALYVLMNLAYMTVLTPTEMIESPAVAVLFGEKMLGSFSFIIPLGVALSTFGCAMSIQFATTRFVIVSNCFMLCCVSYSLVADCALCLAEKDTS